MRVRNECFYRDIRLSYHILLVSPALFICIVFVHTSCYPSIRYIMGNKGILVWFYTLIRLGHFLQHNELIQNSGL